MKPKVTYRKKGEIMEIENDLGWFTYEKPKPPMGHMTKEQRARIEKRREQWVLTKTRLK